MNLAQTVFLILLGSVACPAAETNKALEAGGSLASFGRRNATVHDPSTIVKCKEEYWLFATGRGIPSWRSKDLTSWEAGPRVFTNVPSWTTNMISGNRGYFWAPDIIQAGHQYLLYYSVSTFGKNTSAIGLVANSTLDPADPEFNWSDRGLVIQSHTNDNFNTIDPGVVIEDSGNLWLAFGSFWSGIKLTQLDPGTGKRISPDSPIYPLAHSGSIEAACICSHAGYYYLFVNWGTCCRGVNSTYNIRVGRSQTITGPFVDDRGVDMLSGGGMLLLGTSGTFIGPGHAGILSAAGQEWFSCHFYDGERKGVATLAINPLRWRRNGWPLLERDARRL